MIEIALAVVLGPVLWLAGAIVFDAVHFVLHRMLRSRFGLLRALARPHGVHHEWIDTNLATNWQRQSANVWCHIVPEYATQLVFTAFVALVLPLPFAIVVFALQTAVFAYILSARGRDVNHRPAARIDAHPPGWSTPPSYHALHHRWPDAYFSSYTKVVDRVVGGGAIVDGRRFAWEGPDSPIGKALREEVERAGGGVASVRRDADVLVLTDPSAPLAPAVEAFVEETRERQLPPEVWALRKSAEDPVARHYLTDPRVAFRTLRAQELAPAARAARRALFRIRRDAHFVSLDEPVGWSALRRFLRAKPVAPDGVRLARHRLDLAASTASTEPA